MLNYPSQSNKHQLINSSSQHTYDYPPITTEDELYGGPYLSQNEKPKWEQQSQQQIKSKTPLTASGIGSNYLQNIQQIHSTGKPQQTAVSRQFTASSRQQNNPQQYKQQNNPHEQYRVNLCKDCIKYLR